MCFRRESDCVNSWTMASAWSLVGCMGLVYKKRAPLLRAPRSKTLGHSTSFGRGFVLRVLGVRELHDGRRHDQQGDQSDDQTGERGLHVRLVVSMMLAHLTLTVFMTSSFLIFFMTSRPCTI